MLAAGRVADGVARRLKHRQAGSLLAFAIADTSAAKRAEVTTLMNSDATGLDRKDRQSYEPLAGLGVAGIRTPRAAWGRMEK